jgi:predicted deacetylase
MDLMFDIRVFHGIGGYGWQNRTKVDTFIAAKQIKLDPSFLVIPNYKDYIQDYILPI